MKTTRNQLWIDGSQFTEGGNRTAGFTLIEVILAVALSALLLSVLYSTYFSINRSIDVATEGQDALETGRILSEMLKKDIRGISPNGYTLSGKSEGTVDEALGRIEFVTTSKTSSEQVGLRRVGYELRIDEKRQKVLVKKESSNLNDPIGRSAQVLELSRLIEGFRFEFYNGTEWLAEWDSAAIGALPKQIKVTIDVVDEKGKMRTFVANETIQSTL
jgi:general secretion pathway protein J